MKMRLITLITGVLIGAAALNAQDSLRITTARDVIYGVVEGVGLLADISYPEARPRCLTDPAHRSRYQADFAAPLG